MQNCRVYCTTCDLLIKSGNAKGAKGKKLGNRKCLTGPVELNTVLRHLISDEGSQEVQDALRYYNRRLPFCSFCMELITKIYDFENEMDRIRGLIESMVSCLKMKIQLSLDNISYRQTDENALKLRRAMVGGREEKSPSEDRSVGMINKVSNLTQKDTKLLKNVRTSLKKLQLKTGTAVNLKPVESFPEIEVDSSINPSEEPTSQRDSDHIPSTSSKINEDSISEQNADEQENYDISSDSNSQTAVRRRKSDRIKSTKKTFEGFVSTEDVISEDEAGELLELEDESDEDDDNDDDDNDDDDEDSEDDGEKLFDQILEIENEEPNESDNERASSTKAEKMARKTAVQEVGPKKFQFQSKLFTLLEDGRYKCDSCDKILKTRGGTLLHIKQLHLDWHVVRVPRERKSDEIPKYKRRKTDRRQRTVKVLGPNLFEFEGLQFSKTEEGKFKCGSCPNILKTRDSALVHIKQRHLGEGLGTFLCHLCGKSFERDVYLKLHEINHTNPKSHHCDICGKAFTQYANLYNHKKIHKGELNFHCEIESCGKRFLTRKQLITHMRRHTGERPFECSLCPKKFVRASELTIHLRSHSADRPYECHLCDSKFFIKGRLGRHLKNVHKLVPTNSGSSGRVLPIVTHEVIIEAEAVVDGTQIVDPNSQFVQSNQFLTFNDLY